MALIYRAMTRDQDGKPKLGPTARTLGVRPGTGLHDDIAVNENGLVSPKTGGMSVAPSWRRLPPWRIPRRLSPAAPDACGKDIDACFCHGAGAFEDSAVSDQLDFRADSSDHGLVEPAMQMSIDEFQSALGVTRSDWRVDEE